MKQPPKLKIIDTTEEGGSGNVVTNASWADFLLWFADALPVASASFTDKRLAEPEDKFRVLVRELACEIADLERNLAAERATVKHLTGESPGEIVEGVAVEDFHKLGAAKTPDGKLFDFGALKPTGNTPAVRSAQTTKVFTLDWKTMAQLALAKGVEATETRILTPGGRK